MVGVEGWSGFAVTDASGGFWIWRLVGLVLVLAVVGASDDVGVPEALPVLVGLAGTVGLVEAGCIGAPVIDGALGIGVSGLNWRQNTKPAAVQTPRVMRMMIDQRNFVRDI